MKILRAVFSVNTLLLTAIVAIFVLQHQNLSYSTVYDNEEANYIIVGNEGIFSGDWHTLGPDLWMLCDKFFYPSMVSLAYSINGLDSARLLSVFYGATTAVFICILGFNLSDNSAKEDRYFAGIISALIFLALPTTYFVNRLAVPDIQSFMFLTGGITFLVISHKKTDTAAGYCLVGALFIFLSFISNILTAIYFPFIVLLCLLSLFFSSKNRKKITIIYFLIPLIFFTLSYFYLRQNGIYHIVNLERGHEGHNFQRVLMTFAKDGILILPFAVPGLLGFLAYRKWKKLFVLLILAIPYIVLHILLEKVYFIDRHSYLPFLFLSVIAGVGISEFLQFFHRRFISYIYKLCIVSGILLTLYLGYLDYSLYYRGIDTTKNVSDFLEYEIKPGDKVLTEIGSKITLEVYNKVAPTDVITFDWFQYKDITGADAYANAVKDQYFDVIQINTDKRGRLAAFDPIASAIKENLGDKYRVIYFEQLYVVYEKIDYERETAQL